MRFYWLLLLVCISSLPLIGQSFQDQIGFMSEYYWQSPIYNPCFAGSRSLPTVGLSGAWSDVRNQNPYTLNAFGHFYLDTIKSSFGLTTTYHRYGDTFVYDGVLYPTNKVYFNANGLYNYTFLLNSNVAIQVGAQLGIVHFKTQDVVYNSPINPQPVVLLNERAIKFDLGFGVLLTAGNFYFGTNIAHINEPTFQFYNISAMHRFGRTLYLQTGYNISIADKWYIQPSMMLQSYLIRTYNNSSSVIKPLIDVNLQLNYKQRFFVAAAYRINGDPFFMSVKAGGRFGNTQLSAAYHFGKGNATYTPQRIEASLGLFLWDNKEYIELEEE